jgi:hypothetical protein
MDTCPEVALTRSSPCAAASWKVTIFARPSFFVCHSPLAQGAGHHLLVVELAGIARPQHHVVPLGAELAAQRLPDHTRTDDSDLHGVLRLR